MDAETRAASRAGTLAPRNLRALLAAAWSRLRGGELTPARAATSVALGVFVGCLPLYGLHFWICLGVALALRLDFPLAYLVANLSNPLVAPFLVLAELEIGSFVRSGRFPALSLDDVRARGFTGAFYDALVGGILIGAALATLGAAIAYAITPRQTVLGEVGEAMRRTARRFSASGRFAAGYVRSKLSVDPAMRMIASGERHLGDVLDLGCGYGQLAVLLVEAGRASAVRAVDWDAAKIARGRAALRDAPLDITLEVGDVRDVELGEPDTVLLVDVLHYLTSPDQDRLLERVAASVKDGGSVIVREASGGGGVRAAFTRFAEHVMTRVRHHKGDRVAMRPLDAIVRVLEASGLSCEVLPASEGTPFANALVVARRVLPPVATP